MEIILFFIHKLDGCMDYLPLFLVPCGIGLACNWRSATLGHELGKLLFAFWCGWLLRMTVSLEAIGSDLLRGQLRPRGGLSLIPGRDILPILRYGSPWEIIVNLGGNLGLFLPFGFLAALLWPPLRDWRWSLLAGAGFSCLIESLQRFTPRVTSVDDVILNALGALMGCGLYHIAHWCRVHGKRRS